MKRAQRTPAGMVRFHVDKVRRHASTLRAGRKLSPGAVHLLDVIGRIMTGGATFRVNPSREHLAAVTGYCPRQVTRHLAELEAAQLLEVDRDDPVWHAGVGWHRRRCNRYRLVMPPDARKARSPAGDMGVTRSRSVPTDRTRPAPCGPVEGPPLEPPWAPSPAERARVRAQIAQIREGLRRCS